MTKKIKAGKIIRQEQNERIATLEKKNTYLTLKGDLERYEFYLEFAGDYMLWLESLKKEMQYEVENHPLLQWGGGHYTEYEGEKHWYLPKGYPGGMTGWRKDQLAIVCRRLNHNVTFRLFRRRREEMAWAMEEHIGEEGLPGRPDLELLDGELCSKQCLAWFGADEQKRESIKRRLNKR